MTSGKKSRAIRQTRVPTVQRRRRASPLVVGLVAAGLVVVGLVIGLVLALAGDNSSTTAAPTVSTGSLDSGLPGAAEVDSLLKGIPQRANVLGNASAPVRLVEYVDLQCPFCKEFERTVLPTI